MPDQLGLRERKKLQTRREIANSAARLFAERGYDAVSMADVARAADVSDQTAYNYFPNKQDLVLDRAEQIRGWYDQAIRGRGAALAPAAALYPLVLADIDRYEGADLGEARGEFLAQSVESSVLHRFALEERERQVHVVADAITHTTAALDAALVHLHAAGLIAAVQLIHHQIGVQVLAGSEQARSAADLRDTARLLFDDLDQTFRRLQGGT